MPSAGPKKKYMGPDNIYYTYHLVDPKTNEAFYVGKGKGQRAYIHLTRALHWHETGLSVPGANFHLYNKLLKLQRNGLEPIYVFVLENVSEKEALAREMEDIQKIGIDKLCNLTYGGEGETRSPEILKKISKSLREFWDSEDGTQMRQKFSENRTGEKNPRWGTIEDDEHKMNRMAPMLSRPRWNVGLKGDPRSKGHPKGSLPHNALMCRLINEDGRIVEANSLKKLSELSGVPLMSISRIRAGKKNKKGWRLETIE
jgi:hypothetical protein